MVVTWGALSWIVFGDYNIGGGLSRRVLSVSLGVGNLVNKVWLNSLKLLSKVGRSPTGWVTQICFDAETKGFLFVKGAALLGILWISFIISKLTLSLQKVMCKNHRVLETSWSLRWTKLVAERLLLSFKLGMECPKLVQEKTPPYNYLNFL